MVKKKLIIKKQITKLSNILYNKKLKPQVVDSECGEVLVVQLGNKLHLARHFNVNIRCDVTLDALTLARDVIKLLTQRRRVHAPAFHVSPPPHIVLLINEIVSMVTGVPLPSCLRYFPFTLALVVGRGGDRRRRGKSFGDVTIEASGEGAQVRVDDDVGVRRPPQLYDVIVVVTPHPGNHFALDRLPRRHGTFSFDVVSVALR